MTRRDSSFPSESAAFAFENRLRFERTLAEAGAEVEAFWLRERNAVVRFQPRYVLGMAFGQFIFFAPGFQDAWAVWVGRVEGDGNTYVALSEDRHYFEILRDLGRGFGARRVFDDVVRLYYAMAWHRAPKAETVGLIRDMASRYAGLENRMWALNALSLVYYGMLAEENKNFAPLGRRAKVHGAGRLLLYGDDVESVACCSAGRPWRVTDAEVQSWGLVPDDSRHVLSASEIAALLGRAGA